MRVVEAVLVLVVLATIVAVSARRFRLPAPSLLVAAGVVVGLLPAVPHVEIRPEVVSLVVLPPLLYAAGGDLSWRELHRVWRSVTILALGLVIASAAAVGAVAAAITPMSGPMAFVLGAILASTDPVAVLHTGPGDRPSWRVPAVVSWAGARGVLPLAAALSLLLAAPGRELVITVTAAVIVLTLTVQGFTLSPLVRRAGIATSNDDLLAEEKTADVHMARAALARLDELDDVEAVPPTVSVTLRRALTHRIEEHATPSVEHQTDDAARGEVRRDLIAVEGCELDRLHGTGLIGEGTRRRLQRTLDLEDASLRCD
ncbi:cation:proton antiporter [Dactylosporangium sp. AC04546]|uniref:cation:proton antiporter domain-containing protein n=1 Tax=Dactylosporangium sp. AC04546 TaxID=2862460 RepID=UPI001EDDBDAA|nr:cation:proton antiporter [Dactylosporangium sp. AC04546]WVK78836.1 cation:proton antiporter [Dactylosporangium sp. AC04546]